MVSLNFQNSSNFLSQLSLVYLVWGGGGRGGMHNEVTEGRLTTTTVMLRNLLTFKFTAQLVHALITTRLDFCNSILYNLPKNKIERLQRIQNKAARMLKCSPCRNHITPVLRELHWLRISDRIIFKILIFTHKAFHGVAPVYLCELITKHEHATVRTRRNQDCFLLSIPPISKTCAVSFFERSFLCAAPTLWNKLSIDTRMLEFDQFKSRVKTEHYFKYFEA